jgi:hypothetical protein
MPGRADIGFLIWILAYLGNDRMRFNRLKKPVYIDLAPLLGKSKMTKLSSSFVTLSIATSMAHSQRWSVLVLRVFRASFFLRSRFSRFEWVPYKASA